MILSSKLKFAIIIIVIIILLLINVLVLKSMPTMTAVVVLCNMIICFICGVYAHKSWLQRTTNK